MNKKPTQRVQNYKAPIYIDHVGRPRKLSEGAMIAIMYSYKNGEKTRALAESYGVSTSLIRTICYHVERRD